MKTIALVATLAAIAATAISCANRPGTDQVRLMTLDPGHFHAALVQKSMYPQVDSVVHVYAPVGADLDQHLARIDAFNRRADKPTAWRTEVHAGPDFLERMLSERPGNVVMVSGNNRRKTEYIKRCVDAGLHMLADKPMAIDPAGFALLREAFASARDHGALLYDVMTERFEIATVLQRELSLQPALYGTQERGTPEQPAVVMESVHYLLKEVAGKPLIRPAWFFDVTQQGEALADVGTHLVDLAQWELFPGVCLDWTKDIRVLSARRWQTAIPPDDFRRITGQEVPGYLRAQLSGDGALDLYANGETLYTLRGVHIRIVAKWDVRPPGGGNDTHYSQLRGSRAALTIRQGTESHALPALFVEGAGDTTPAETGAALPAAIASLAQRFPGLGVAPAGTAWQVTIPAAYYQGHEAHFAQVTGNFLSYLASGALPDWEVPNMIAKYYTTTEAFRLSHAAP